MESGLMFYYEDFVYKKIYKNTAQELRGWALEPGAVCSVVDKIGS